MSKWKITGISLVVLVLAGVAFVNSPLMMATVFYFLQPDESFAQTTPPDAPDYSNPEHWASLPSKQDPADVSPKGVASEPGDKVDVAVFFVHPTTFLENTSWNQPLDHEVTNQRTDATVLPNQTSAYNVCCDVYAPRYRQATLFSFSDQSAERSGEQALALAYGDVAKAFEQFLQENPTRPFILAGHSQGSHHLDRLIEEKLIGTALIERLVAAYPIGFSVDTSNGLPVCESATQTGCQVSWNASAEGAGYVLPGPGDICVNPLTWAADEEPAEHEANLGGILAVKSGEIEPGVADAQCQDGKLIVSEIRSENYGARPFGEGNYHIYDYSLYYMNLRQNILSRVAAFLTTADVTNVTN